MNLPVAATADVGAARREKAGFAAADIAFALSRVAFSVLIVLSPFRARMVLDHRQVGTIYGDYTNLIVFWSDIALVSVVALWGLGLALEGRRPWWGPVLLRWPAGLLLATVWLSVPFSTDTAISAYDAVRLTLAVGLGLYAANEVRSIRELAPALATMIAVQAIVGIGQVLAQWSFGLGPLGEYHLNPQDAGVSIVWTENSAKLLRAYGLTDHPNILGGLLAAGLVLLGAALVQTRSLWAMVLNAVFALGLVTLFLTFSRGAQVAVVGGLLLVFALLAYRGQWRRLSLWVAACVAAAVMAAGFVKPYWPYLSARLNPEQQQAGSTEQRSLSERSALAKNTNTIFTRHPVVGVGFGALPQAMREQFPDFGYNYQPAHFALIDVAAETGMVGAMAYTFLMAAPWLLLWFRRRQLTPAVIGASGALAALGFVGLIDYYTWSLAPGQIWAWLVLGVWAGAYSRMARGEADA